MHGIGPPAMSKDPFPACRRPSRNEARRLVEKEDLGRQRRRRRDAGTSTSSPLPAHPSRNACRMPSPCSGRTLPLSASRTPSMPARIRFSSPACVQLFARLHGLPAGNILSIPAGRFHCLHVGRPACLSHGVPALRFLRVPAGRFCAVPAFPFFCLPMPDCHGGFRVRMLYLTAGRRRAQKREKTGPEPHRGTPGRQQFPLPLILRAPTPRLPFSQPPPSP